MTDRIGAVKTAFLAIVTLLVTFAAVSFWALESGGVAVVSTRAPDGGLRTTHVWYAESDGELWLEAGSPENAWYRDVLRDPRIEFSADDQTGPYLAEPADDPSAPARIRALLREKYGFRDWWVGGLVDSSRSLAVRLVPTDADPHGEP